MTFVLVRLLIFVAIAIIIVKSLSHGAPSDDSSYREDDAIRNSLAQESEGRIANILNRLDGRIYNNICIRNKTGNGSTQIDHVFINQNGVWVIETKRWVGKIDGYQQDEHWVHETYEGIKIERNPIIQNKGHVYCLEKYLGNSTHLKNLVVIDGDCELNVLSDNVCLIKDLEDVISRKTLCELNPTEINEYYSKILQVINENSISKEEHIQNIKKLH